MPSHAYRFAAVLVACLGLLSPVLSQSDPQTEDWSRQDQKYMERMKPKSEEERQEARSPEEIREKYIEQARELIRDKNYAVKKTPHYLIRTDDPRIDPAAAGLMLEQFRGAFIRYWEGEVELKPYERISPVFLFYSYYKFNKIVTGKARFDEFQPAGHYQGGLDLITLHSDSSVLDDVPVTLVHEATHQLMEQMHYGNRSGWISEGMANYFSLMETDTEGNFKSGKIGTVRNSVSKDGGKSRSDAARNHLVALRKALKKKEDGLRILDIVDIGTYREFYGPEIRIHYAASWALVHYLLHGEDGRYRQGFLRFMENDGPATTGSRVLLESIGADAESFQAGFIRHVGKM
ncbi:MAG: DUF1570 domain-containing protein [Acidobacteria bacterium]|uniref:DUF1570 domain-containing protein n=1 Tax=Candidatus Polarisedimenticola svalbardensis TaxID=2886004 RepID=A0A8J6Y034_9BACT|nr:DUF1570 domain-containing protein [Candidatus Polarisedimenticola svalbardensis]